MLVQFRYINISCIISIGMYIYIYLYLYLPVNVKYICVHIIISIGTIRVNLVHSDVNGSGNLSR